MRAMVVVQVALATAGATSLFSGMARADSPFPDLRNVALVDKVTATSTFSDKHDPTDYSPVRAIDPERRGDPTTMSQALWTAWCEGKPDEGLGETLTVTFAEPTKLDSVKIAAGVWRTEALFKANNQITSLDVIADGKAQTVKPSGMDYVEATLGTKVTTLAFKIRAVKKGKANDTCISEIQLFRDGRQLQPVVGADPTAWAALPGAVQAIQKAIDDPGKKGLDALVEWPLKLHDMMGDKAYGGSKDATDANLKELLAACKVYSAASEKSDGWVDPLGCPQPVNHDADDDRGDRIGKVSATSVVILFQSHGDLAVTWRLHWAGGKWKLQEINDQAWW